MVVRNTHCKSEPYSHMNDQFDSVFNDDLRDPPGWLVEDQVDVVFGKNAMCRVGGVWIIKHFVLGRDVDDGLALLVKGERHLLDDWLQLYLESTCIQVILRRQTLTMRAGARSVYTPEMGKR